MASQAWSIPLAYLMLTIKLKNYMGNSQNESAGRGWYWQIQRQKIESMKTN